MLPETTNQKTHLFQPGVSGNPSGRPKSDATIRALAKEHTADALRTLVEIAGNKKSPPSARVHAACAILDRGWGKPSMYIEAVHGLTYMDYLKMWAEEDELAPDDNVVVVGAISVKEVQTLSCGDADQLDLDGI